MTPTEDRILRNQIVIMHALAMQVAVPGGLKHAVEETSAFMVEQKAAATGTVLREHSRKTGE